MFGTLEKTLRLVGTALKVRSYKHNLLASNIANVDTPGYRRKDIPFQKVMEAYLNQQKTHLPLKTSSLRHIKNTTPPLSLKTTSTRHISNPVKSSRHKKIEKLIKAYESQTLGTPNNVSLEEEMVDLTQNQMLYEATLQALSKELQMLNQAITEGGK